MLRAFARCQKFPSDTGQPPPHPAPDNPPPPSNPQIVPACFLLILDFFLLKLMPLAEILNPVILSAVEGPHVPRRYHKHRQEFSFRSIAETNRKGRDQAAP